MQAHEDDKAESLEIEAVTKRIKSNPALYQPFPQHPEAEAWLQQFSGDALRYPVMIVLGTSGRGKTEWAKSLFKNPLTLLIGTLGRGALGEMIEVRGYTYVFILTALIGVIAVVLCIAEWVRVVRLGLYHV